MISFSDGTSMPGERFPSLMFSMMSCAIAKYLGSAGPLDMTLVPPSSLRTKDTSTAHNCQLSKRSRGLNPAAPGFGAGVGNQGGEARSISPWGKERFQAGIFFLDSGIDS